MKILGVDPGLDSSGYALIESSKGCDLSNLKDGVNILNFSTIAPDSKKPLEERLKYIHSKFKKLLSELEPDVVVVEDIYSNSSYPQAGLKMASVKGVVELAVSQKNIKIVNIAATKVKKTIIGRGNAKKEQVAKMMEEGFNLKGAGNLHESDALAVALAYLLITTRKVQVL
ncbi:MAG: crossover junction endodeoxyribonuclease RuvC [Candidatus Kaelpia imicola]|nr:crossover junction endodeoxyribonuclease RuvC [Candidatus Kaelpia imicola]